ncbi:hypothetical protein OAK66_01565 [Candidatus Nitrosopelagicus sp.]|nr:hypothetical protein [Candidatus Nitrosopelagicus sp.]
MGKHSRSKNSNDGEQNSEVNNVIQRKINNPVIWLICSIGIFVVLLSLISVVFPGLIISVVDTNLFGEVFELGAMGIPLIIVNIIIFSLIILGLKEKLPRVFTNIIEKILSFDLSKRNSFIILIIILAIYVVTSVNELSINELNQYGDFLVLEKAVKIWPEQEAENKYLAEQLDRHVRMALLVASEEVFNNIKVIPYLASIFLLITTYFLTVKLSNKNFTGLIAVVLVLQSSTFYIYDTIAVYENFWVLFYVFSIYLIFKKPKFSSIFYILAIFSKAIFVLWLPISILVTLLSDIPKNKKIFVIITHIIVIIISLIIFQYSNAIYGNVVDIEISEFLIGFTTLASNLRFDILLLLFLLPVSVGLLLKARNGCMNSVSLIVLISGTILVTPVLEMITDYYFVYPYRYVPLIVFFAIGLSTLFSKK